MSDEEEVKAPLLALFKGVASASLILAALLYIAGWTYFYQYYKYFGLNVSDLDLPLYHALLYALPVLFDSFWSAAVTIILIALGGILLNLAWVEQRMSTPLGTGVAFIVLLAAGFILSLWGAHVGRATASRDLVADRSMLPSVALQIEPEKSPDDSEDVAQFDRLEFKLLTHANGQYYVFRPFKEAGPVTGKLPSANVEVFAFPDSRVKKVRIQRGVDNP
jgi:hypothetical protein